MHNVRAVHVKLAIFVIQVCNLGHCIERGFPIFFTAGSKLLLHCLPFVDELLGAYLFQIAKQYHFFFHR